MSVAADTAASTMLSILLLFFTAVAVISLLLFVVSKLGHLNCPLQELILSLKLNECPPLLHKRPAGLRKRPRSRGLVSRRQRRSQSPTSRMITIPLPRLKELSVQATHSPPPKIFNSVLIKKCCASSSLLHDHPLPLLKS